MACDNPDCVRPEERVSDNEAHEFSGYGFYVKYHPECCPRWEDGMDCLHEHPLFKDARIGRWPVDPSAPRKPWFGQQLA